MNLTQLDISRALYELSGWDDTEYCHKTVLTGDLLEFRAISLTEDAGVGANARFVCPAYDLGYLLRKLPFFHEYWNGGNEAGYLTVKHWAVQYEAGYWEENGDRDHYNKFTSGYADTPEDAAAKLAVELFKKGVLTRDGDV